MFDYESSQETIFGGAEAAVQLRPQDPNRTNQYARLITPFCDEQFR
jgi:hypothetical protein